MPNQSFTNPVLYGRPRPCRTKSESQASTSQLRQADRCQGKRKALARPSSAKANARRSPDQAVPGQSQDTHQDKQRRGKLPPSKPIRTSSARYTNRNRQPPGETGDFSLQRSGTISSGPLKKLRVSCVHERDGKQVPCVRSLCSYARESRAC